MDASLRAACRSFADEHIRPNAVEWDSSGVDISIARELGGRGWLVADDATLGVVCDEIGGACNSTRSLITVQNLVASALTRWGTPEQRDKHLPGLRNGHDIAGFCLTELQAGSDASAITTTITPDGDALVINGRKLWVTFGQSATYYLVIGLYDNISGAVLVPRHTPGVTVAPVSGLLGMRGSRIGHVNFDNCRVPASNLLGKPGFGVAGVAATAIDHGRFTIAWGCVGIMRDCLRRTVAHATTRSQSGQHLADHQLVARMIATMQAKLRTSELLCESATKLRTSNSPEAIAETMLAKYVSAAAACDVASDAVQILGAQGVDPSNAVERHYRDSKIMRIIEGTDQVLEQMLSTYAIREHG